MVLVVVTVLLSLLNAAAAPSPLVVVSTWPFVEAVRSARRSLEAGGSAVDAVVQGCSTCENLRCDGSVGYGGSPDENGETTLDAMVMDGTSMDVGAVGALRFVKDAARAAKMVLEHTEHTLLVGDQASQFAISLGLEGPVDLSSDSSIRQSARWHNSSSCQPNFWKSVEPNSKSFCGPYHLAAPRLGCSSMDSDTKGISYNSHDTISMAAIDGDGKIAVGTSTNGATFKIPGRVGDGPIVGAGGYADTDVGACGATGDGDVMMRFLPCYQVVESMRMGMSPKEAARDAIARIRRKFPSFIGAVFALDNQGRHAGACHGWNFQYSVWKSGMEDASVISITPHP